jgi:AraC family transcriptional regulator, transcriptional activator of pobA
MKAKGQHIPVNTLPEGSSRGIMFLKKRFDGPPEFDSVKRSHRDGGFTFIVQETGKTYIEIDFETYCITAPAIVFIHPEQVHRLVSFENAMLGTWIIALENIHGEYLTLLNKMAPVNPLAVSPVDMELLMQHVDLCLKLSHRQQEKLYSKILRDGCNALIGLVLSQYLPADEPEKKQNRYLNITQAFKTELENHFKTLKSPKEYAGLLHISTSYLNECVKTITGQSVSTQIRQRVVLEAKRLLYHSNRSVKEIANDLGYEDFSYFTRIFVKMAGMTPVVFRSENRD